MSMVIIRSEKADDIPIGTAILMAAYGRDDAARMVNAVRDATEYFHPGLSIVAAEDDQIVGYALYCRAMVAAQPSAFLVTLGVLPDKQKQGIGERLVRHGLERCRGLGLELVFVLGHPEYFSRLGFRPARPLGIESEFAENDNDLQAIDLAGTLLGKITGSLRLPVGLKNID